MRGDVKAYMQQMVQLVSKIKIPHQTSNFNSYSGLSLRCA